MNFIKKISAGLFYLLAFLLPLQTRLIIRPGIVNLGYLEYGTISLYLTDIILVVFLSVLVLNLALPTRKKFIQFNLGQAGNKWDYALIALALLELAVFISVWFAPYKLLALYKYILFLGGIAIFLLVRQGQFFSRLKFIYSLLAGIFLQALLAIYQFVTQSTFACKFLGLASHDSALPGVSVVETYDRSGLLWRWLRAYGGLDHPNMLGGVLAIGLILIIWLLLERKHWGIKTENYRLYLIINYFGLFFIAAALILTFSRAAYLAAGLGAAIMILINGRCCLKKNINPKSLDCRLTVGIGLALVVIWSLVFSIVDVRFQNYNRLQQISYNERAGGYSEALKLIAEKPFTGWGLGNYYIASFSHDPYYPAFHYQPVHNVFMLVAAEIGLPGLLFFVAFLAVLLWEKIKGWKINGPGLALLAACLVISLVDHWFFSLHFGVFFVWLVLGIVAWEKKE